MRLNEKEISCCVSPPEWHHQHTLYFIAKMNSVYQVMMEQKDFMRSKGIKQSRQFMSIGLNAVIFATQFFAIKVHFSTVSL